MNSAIVATNKTRQPIVNEMVMGSHMRSAEESFEGNWSKVPIFIAVLLVLPSAIELAEETEKAVTIGSNLHFFV